MRLIDNSSFLKASANADILLPIFIHHQRDDSRAQWNFPRVGVHRKKFLNESLDDLSRQLKLLNSALIELHGNLESIFLCLKKNLGSFDVYTQKIEAPEETQDINVLEKMGIRVTQTWQSSMIDPDLLPFELAQMPDVFTQFRQKIEREKIRFSPPVLAPNRLPSLPHESNIKELFSSSFIFQEKTKNSLNNSLISLVNKPANHFRGGEVSANEHLKQYLLRRLPDSYKKTRNQLIGMDYSSKFSPWLAHGCLSARSIASELYEYEKQWGANEGTYWLWFELLWRDYFHFLPFKYGKRLFFSKGLGDKQMPKLNEKDLNLWVNGQTKEPFINAAMRELSLTGYLSNRMRQIVASYWIYDMCGAWIAGAAWFESQLIDYDVYSNQGNWLYIAGRGTDPRGGRAFNVEKQMREYDPEGTYRKMWQ